jgi:hypothetical protein
MQEQELTEALHQLILESAPERRDGLENLWDREQGRDFLPTLESDRSADAAAGNGGRRESPFWIVRSARKVMLVVTRRSDDRALEATPTGTTCRFRYRPLGGDNQR